MDRRTFIVGSAASIVLAAAGALVGCAPRKSVDAQASSSSTTDDAAQSAAEPSQATSAGKTLMVFFSRVGENYTSSGIVETAVGNTEVMAGYIEDALGCDVFKIEPVEAYPHDYTRAQSEQDGDARPAIANIAGLPPIAAYDTVLVGSGIWWGKPPMIMRTFLESFDFSGKTIIPFTTNGGSGLGTAVEDYSRLCPSATVSSNGLAVLGEDVAKDETRQRVEQWARLL